MEIHRNDAATSISREVEVAICPECKGAGKKVVFIGNSKDDEYGTEHCKVCNGSGMVKKVVIITVFPFNNKD